MIPRDARPRRRSHGPRAPRLWGFTLLELMLAVIIVAMLMTIAVPGITRLMNSAKRAASLATVSALENGCVAFYDDFDAFPPSHGSGEYEDWIGAQLLPLFLTGYAPDMGDNGIAGGELPKVFDPHVPTPADDSNTFDEDDGVDDYGFRLVPAGRVYGPYLGAERTKSMKFGPGDRPVFIDAFGNPIFYYAWRGNKYHADDNAVEGDLDGPLTPKSGGSGVGSDYAKDADGLHFRRDFILVSAGPDGRFASFRSSSVTDDITNFLREE